MRKPIKEYMTDRTCFKCGTTLVFAVYERKKGGYSGVYRCEACMKNRAGAVVTDEMIVNGKWKVLE